MSGTRVDVTEWDVIRVEPKGASPKLWLRDPGHTEAGGRDWLFKPTKVHADGSRQIGDWTEATACAIGRALGVPSAIALPAVRHGTEGVISRDLRLPGFDMLTGRMTLFDELDVVTRDSRRDKTASIGHSLVNVERALERYGPPPADRSWAGASGFDVMCAHLIVDALIGNGDRHEQNWSVLRATSSDGSSHDGLAPAYDLEASLGFQLTDDDRMKRLRDRDALDAFVRRGRARRFDGDRHTSLVDFAGRAFDRSSDLGKALLLDVVSRISRSDHSESVALFDGVSEVARTFAHEILIVNGRRIEDEIDRRS